MTTPAKNENSQVKLLFKVFLKCHKTIKDPFAVYAKPFEVIVPQRNLEKVHKNKSFNLPVYKCIKINHKLSTVYKKNSEIFVNAKK